MCLMIKFFTLAYGSWYDLLQIYSILIDVIYLSELCVSSVAVEYLFRWFIIPKRDCSSFYIYMGASLLRHAVCMGQVMLHALILFP